MGWESHGLEDSPVDVARYRAVDDESGNLLVRAALGDEDRKGDVIDPRGWMVMFSRGLGGGDEMGVVVWVATAPWPPRCPHPSPLPPSGRGDGCCGRGRFGSGEGGGGCGARTAHRVDGAVGVNESGSTALTKMIRSAEEYDSAMSRIDEIFDAPVGTPEGDELDLIVNQVEVYEAERYPIPPPDPVDAIEFRIDQGR